jgi:hypothetical protein
MSRPRRHKRGCLSAAPQDPLDPSLVIRCRFNPLWQLLSQALQRKDVARHRSELRGRSRWWHVQEGLAGAKEAPRFSSGEANLYVSASRPVSHDEVAFDCIDEGRSHLPGKSLADGRKRPAGPSYRPLTMRRLPLGSLVLAATMQFMGSSLQTPLTEADGQDDRVRPTIVFQGQKRPEVMMTGSSVSFQEVSASSTDAPTKSLT